MTAISAMLNSSGENAVSAEAPLRARQRQQHRGGAGEGEIGQHQPGVLTASCSVSCPANPGASTVMTSGISRPISTVRPRSARR